LRDEIHTRRILKDHAGLDAEFLQEIAEALGTAGERLERAIAQVDESAGRIEELRRELQAASGQREREATQGCLREEILRYKDLREKALEQYRWFLIHREAIGLRNHKIVAEQYKIPPEIRMPRELGVRSQESE
jgi:hypothetical protein